MEHHVHNHFHPLQFIFLLFIYHKVHKASYTLVESIDPYQQDTFDSSDKDINDLLLHNMYEGTYNSFSDIGHARNHDKFENSSIHYNSFECLPQDEYYHSSQHLVFTSLIHSYSHIHA